MRIHPKASLTDEEQQALRDRVLSFMSTFTKSRIIINKGLNGEPRYRLMGTRNDGLTVYLVSVKPSQKLAELEADPTISVLYYQYDANEGDVVFPYDGIDQSVEQPIRLVAIRGTAEIVTDVARIRQFPGGPVQPLDDERLAAERFGVIVRPTSVRVEGFLPGPRFPVYLPVP